MMLVDQGGLIFNRDLPHLGPEFFMTRTAAKIKIH